MLNLPYVNQISKNISSIDAFLGLNKGFKIGENELSDSYNMCSDDYPVLSTRRKRLLLKASEENNGLFEIVSGVSSVVVSNNKLACLLKSGALIYDDKVVNLNIQNNRLLRVGNMLYAYPSGTLIKLPNNKDGEITTEITHTRLQFIAPTDDAPATGNIDDGGMFTGFVIFQPAISSGIGKTSYYLQPSEPTIGDYWCDGESLNMWGDTGSGEMGWVSVEPDCIRVSNIVTTTEKENSVDTLWFKKVFRTGDAVFISGTGNEKTDRSFIVEDFGDSDDPAMYLSGYLKTDYIASGCVIEKKMPEKLDFVIEHNNRLWGCFYGYDSQGNFYNEIYATAQNDPTNWYRYDGTPMQSYAMSVVSDGKFTGAAVINGYVTFFKENCMHRIYGNSPADFQLVSYECAGIQEGCEKSFAGSNGLYFYKSNIGVMYISDGYPVKISEKIGHDSYTEAVGGTDGSCYYLQMKNEEETVLYVYDIHKKIWHCENSIENLCMFFNYRNNLFTVSEKIQEESQDRIDSAYNSWINATGPAKAIAHALYYSVLIAAVYDVFICTFSKSKLLNVDLPKISISESTELYEEDDFSWSFETADMGYSYYLTKHVDKICVRAMVDAYARMDIDIVHDSEGEWDSVATIIGDGTVKTMIIPIRPNECDHFRLRFSGIGDVKILNVIMKYQDGSDYT